MAVRRSCIVSESEPSSLPVSATRLPSVPFPPATRSEINLRLWETTLRSSRTALYFGSNRSPGKRPGSRSGCSTIALSRSTAATKRFPEAVDSPATTTPAHPAGLALSLFAPLDHRLRRGDQLVQPLGRDRLLVEERVGPAASLLDLIDDAAELAHGARGTLDHLRLVDLVGRLAQRVRERRYVLGRLGAGGHDAAEIGGVPGGPHLARAHPRRGRV